MIEVELIDSWNSNENPAELTPNWKPPKPQGALAKNPKTENQQSPLGFRFYLRRSPTTNYFVMRVNVPGIQLPPTMEATPFLYIPKPGDHPQFDPLVLTFRVDEGMNNYFEIQDWLKTISGLSGGKAYKKLDKTPGYTGFGVESEILVSVLDAAKNPVRNITYHDAWPTSLTGLQYDASLTSVEYLTATATFYYLDYTSSLNV